MDQEHYINMALAQTGDGEQAPNCDPIEPDLNDSEQYRMQMAAISTAAIGYWRPEDSIHPDYDTVALRDVAKLYARYAECMNAIRDAMNELGVPQPGYAQPVANAYDHLHRAFYAEIGCILGEGDYRPAEKS